MIWRCADFEFDTKMPIVMGILNVTPDSFSDGGEHEEPEQHQEPDAEDGKCEVSGHFIKLRSGLGVSRRGSWCVR